MRTTLLTLALAACAKPVHTASVVPPSVSFALDAAAVVVEVEGARAGALGCVAGPVVAAAARSAAAFLRGSGTLAGFTVDPAACGLDARSVPLPPWLPGVLRGLVELVPANAPCGVVAAIEYVTGAAAAVAQWATDTTQPVVVPGVEVCGG